MSGRAQEKVNDAPEVDKQDELLAELEDFHSLAPSPVPVIFNLFI